MDFRFQSLQDESEVKSLEHFLRLQSLGYPRYQDWVTRAREELLSSYKRAILAFSEGRIVGDLIPQQHKTFPRVREIKNLRVHPKIRNRYFGAFMLKQAEETDKSSYDAIIGDIRSDQIEALNLFKISGYEELARTSLYEDEAKEIIVVKRFERTPKGFFIPLNNSFHN